MRPLRERVALSARELDRENPLWACLVEPRRLDMQDTKRCILGFMAGSYQKGLRYLGLSHERDAEERAFTTRDPREWKELDQAWKYEVSLRVAA